MDLMAGVASAENGPILYTEPNRTSAVDDPRSLVIYVFIVTIFFSFFLILPGIRSDKFPTFLCVTSSLLVTSIILLSLLGTTWHTGHVSISAPYKAFSVDRIHGELTVRIGLRSVNISLIAHKYYELANNQRPVLMVERTTNATTTSSSSPTTTTTTTTAATSIPILGGPTTVKEPLSGEVLAPTSTELVPNDNNSSDTEILELDEAFISSRSGADGNTGNNSSSRARRATPVANSTNRKVSATIAQLDETFGPQLRYTVERSNVDINYNERFYWIEPNQMRQEHQSALERGLPFPILTVVEYLSQDEAGFSWSRQYRLAGYYSHILLTWALCLCLLMFFLHCATPKYGIYAMQILGCLLLITNFTYSTLVPRGDQRLVIPFEGGQLEFQFGWSYWLVFSGGCLSLSVGTLIVIIDRLFPNYIFTTILDVDFDSHNNFLANSKPTTTNNNNNNNSKQLTTATINTGHQLAMPPFMVASHQQKLRQQDINGSAALVRRPSFIADETTEPFSSQAARAARPSLLAGIGHSNLALEEEPEEEAEEEAEDEEDRRHEGSSLKTTPTVTSTTPDMVSRHRQRPQKLATHSSVLEMP